MSESIEQQRKQVFESDFRVDLNAPCTIGNGVLRIEEDMKQELLSYFDSVSVSKAFFIPASGSGSRMFQFLFEWSDSIEDNSEIASLVESMSSLPAVKEYLEHAENAWELTQLLIKNVASKPKGLIPFHDVNGKILTAFQEHALQTNKLFPEGIKLHFTVQASFLEEIKSNLNEVIECSNSVQIEFSEQSKDSDAFCFDKIGSVIHEGGSPLRRPAGHGALISNLNSLSEDLIFIKNIDNVQHFSRCEVSNEVWKLTAGLLLKFRSAISRLKEDSTIKNLIELNREYQFVSESEIEREGAKIIDRILTRPTRVCGMVKNTGEPGGGPFWINDNGVVTKQIIEKAQIKSTIDQLDILSQSTHFNPVFIVLCKSDAEGNRLDLNDFVDHDKYFVVNKSHKGEDIYYRELPGLWNGSMGNWNTLFVEIPSEVFSPVKTILDLAKPLHMAQ